MTQSHKRQLESEQFLYAMLCFPISSLDYVISVTFCLSDPHYLTCIFLSFPFCIRSKKKEIIGSDVNQELELVNSSFRRMHNKFQVDQLHKTKDKEVKETLSGHLG